MKIVIESGATKADWRMIHDDGSTTVLQSAGMNLSVDGGQNVREQIHQVLCNCEERADEVFFYAAGAVDGGPFEPIRDIFKEGNPGCKVEILSDTLASARALFGDGPGIAAILGTGSNSCFYDGTRCIMNVRSGGFILGDEGSAATLGRLLLSDHIKGLVPEAIEKELGEQFDLSYFNIVENVYRKPSPSAYLGSFAPFMLSHRDHPYVKGLIESNLRAFIERNLLKYDTDCYPVGVTGGFGCAVSDILEPLANSYGISVAKFVKSPVDALVEYHRK